MKHHLLNAILRGNYALLTSWFPSYDNLLPYYSQRRQEFAQELEAITRDASVSPKLRVQQLYMDRFNISALDVSLLKGPQLAVSDSGGAEVRWANYCRSVLKPLHFYRFEELEEGRASIHVHTCSSICKMTKLVHRLRGGGVCVLLCMWWLVCVVWVASW